MKMQKKNYFLDTSVLSPISISPIGDKQSYEDTIARYECFLDQMDLYHPGFVDIDFTWVTTPALFLELIGLGQVRKKMKRLVNSEDWKSFIFSNHEEATGLFCDQIIKRVKLYIIQNWSGSKLYRFATVDFLRTFETHSNAHFVASKIKRWAKDLRKPEYYDAFVKAIVLDTLFRYPFINLKEISLTDRPQAMKLWAGVIGRLCRVYFELRDRGFEYSVMGLFAEVHRLGGLFNSPNPDQEKYDILIRTWDDMADGDAINYALLGRKKCPVHVITMDQKKDIERRLQCLAQNLKDLESLGFSTEFYSGTVTVFSESLQVIDYFLVKDIIA